MKRLLSISEVKQCEGFPKNLEVSSKVLSEFVKDDPSIICNMPNLYEKQNINKQSLVDVLNKVFPDSMRKLM